GPGAFQALRAQARQEARRRRRDVRPGEGGRRRADRPAVRRDGADRRVCLRGAGRVDRAGEGVRRGRRRRGLRRGPDQPSRVPRLCEGPRPGPRAREPHGVRQDAALHARRAQVRRGQDRPVPPRRLPRDEPGGREGVRGDPQARDAEIRRRRDADARRALRRPGLRGVRAQARPPGGRPGGKGRGMSKKSVALSGVVAGNTAICTVGHTGNDLHYRGYEIGELAQRASYEEVAYLLIHGRLPTEPELDAYARRLARYRLLPEVVRAALELIPAEADPMDVLRTGCSVLGAAEPEEQAHGTAGARAIADRLIASFGSMLLYWHHFARDGRRIETATDEPSLAGHFLRLLHGRPAPAAHVRALDLGLILYAEHEFNASTFTARVIAGTGSDLHSAICGAIGALRGPKHGGANEVAIEIALRYGNEDEAEA